MARLYKKDKSGRFNPLIWERSEFWLFVFLAISTALYLMFKVFEGLGVAYKPLLNYSIYALMGAIFVLIYILTETILEVKKVGSLKLFLKAKNAETMILNGLIDVLAVNTMKQSSFIKAPAVAVAPSVSDGWSVSIEKLSGMRDIELIKDTINSSLIGTWQAFAVIKSRTDKTGNYFDFVISDISDSNRLVIKNIKELKPKKPYVLAVQNGLSWNIAKAPHALIAGDSGSGKTAILMTLIAQLMAGGSSIYVVDPKVEFTFLESILPNGSVVREFDEVLKLFETVNEEMDKRNRLIAESIKSKGVMGLTGADLGMKPIVIVMDEVGSLVANIDNKELKRFTGMMIRLVQMGRSSLTNLIITTQQPNAQVISTAIRDQLSLRILMGSPSPELKRMVFGDGVELNEYLDNYTGHYVLNGQTFIPQLFEGIDLHKNKFNQLSTFKKCYEVGRNKVSR